MVFMLLVPARSTVIPNADRLLRDETVSDAAGQIIGNRIGCGASIRRGSIVAALAPFFGLLISASCGQGKQKKAGDLKNRSKRVMHRP
jgi:hypothetical protein